MNATTRPGLRHGRLLAWLGVGARTVIADARRHWLVFVAFGAIWALALTRVFIHHTPILPVLFNWTASLPYRIVVVDHGPMPLARGDLIVYAFDGEAAERDYPGLKRQPFFKRIAGVAGDVVTVDGRDVFINGLPIATFELKNSLTKQTVEDAVEQYRRDRNPRERLFEFGRCVVHFAVDDAEVRMCTELKGKASWFLPFNKGWNDGAGNPPNPAGLKTDYLWKASLTPAGLTDILENYAQIVEIKHPKTGKKKRTQVFPRYHQLDATRRLVQAVLAEGAGQKYLIQHSAGSGKTNSIAWLAHFLADLHDANNDKVFDTVLVVSDRTVLDTQLQEAIFDFERTAGVVATIKGAAGSKSAELAEALSGSKKIVVCTIQTFPFALKAVQELAATQGKRFAVIADEAHSSQTGEAASKLKQLLNAEELKDLADGGEVSTEDLLAAQMAARASAGQDAGITYVAFTATPKAKTLELFGRRPNPALPAGPDNLPAPFHVYSMRQAIEEGFILDVLKNYTPYKLAFKLANNGQEWDEKEVERSEAMKGLMRWVRLHPYNISQKVAVVVEHFAQNVQPLLNGHAKAMVVVGSRLEAVRWKLAIDDYIMDNGYKLGTLVAFSGEVNDPESLPEPVTETSAKLNPNLKSRDMREAFATDEYQILLVANKFQTGFDQPLLCGMYVDKRLSGIQAVQTLSRLNRAYSGPHGHKDTTYILDFVNDPDEVLTAFRQYFETAELAGMTDPDLVFNLKSKLDGSGHYDEFEVERVVLVVMNPKATHSMLTAAIEPVADRLLKRYKAAKALIADNGEDKRKGKATQAAKDEVNALLLFRADLGSFIRVYAFLSQMFDYGNTGIEKRALFFKHLLPLLDFGRDREGVDLSKVVLTHHRLKDEGHRDLALGQYASENSENDKLQPMTATGSGEVQDKQKALLSAIVEKVNDLFEGELSDNDKLVYVNHVIKGKLMESDLLQQQAANNSKSQFANSPDLDHELMNAIMDALSAHTTMSKQALDSVKVRKGLKDILLGPAGLYEALRGQA